MSGLDRRITREDAGQTIVLVSLLAVMLVGFTGLAIDAGRLYAEHRYLQNAVDAGALACAGARTQGRATAEAEQIGRDTITSNLAANPLGIDVTVPLTPVYDPTVLLPRNLVSGVLVDTYGCRAALRTAVPTIFVRVVNPNVTAFVDTARAYAIWKSGFLPGVVQRWENPPGPGGGFQDHLKQEFNDSLNCPVGGPDGCPWATFASPGAQFALMGQGAKAINDSSFRGNIVLDIRDFETVDGLGNPIHTGYNGVNGNENPDTLKEFEANWIVEGYPGPDICAADAIVLLRCAQIAITHGNTAGKYIDFMNKRYKPGDIVMLQVYDGYIKSIPDFTMTGITVLNVGTSQTINPGTITVSGSTQFRAPGTQVAVTVEPDPGDPLHPVTLGTLDRGTLTPVCSPSPGYACGYGVPNYSLTWTGLQTTAAQKGIYVLWLRGDAGPPYDTIIHEQPLVLNVGNQNNDFTAVNSTQNVAVDPKGPAANFNVNLRKLSAWDNPVTLTIEDCPGGQPVVPPYQCYFNNDAYANTWSMVPGPGAGTDVALTVGSTGGLSSTAHHFRVRATGVDDDGSPVTRLILMRLDVETAAGGATEYVDVMGYALFKLTVVDSNSVIGRAVSRMELDPDDLNPNGVVRLVQWTYTP